MNERDAFLLGYLPPAAGPYFNGLELLAEAARLTADDAALAPRIGELREGVVAGRDESLGRLGGVEDLLAAAGLPAVPRPADAAAFPGWAEAVFAAIDDALPGDSPEAVTHLLGYVLGEAEATLDAIAVVSRVRELAPDHVWMRLQADSLERERATGERRLGRLAAHPLLAPPVQEATARAAHAVTMRDGAGAAEQARAIASLLG